MKINSLLYSRCGCMYGGFCYLFYENIPGYLMCGTWYSLPHIVMFNMCLDCYAILIIYIEGLYRWHKNVFILLTP